MEKQREGVLVEPQRRLSEDLIKLVDETSRELLEDPGIICYSEAPVRVFQDAGAKTEDIEGGTRIRIPSKLLDKALSDAPSRVVLGARDPDNRLILDASEPRVRFGTGSETNEWLEVEFEGESPRFTVHDGNIERLRLSAHLCDNLEHLDFFIRNVNIQDKEIDDSNKDVNKFLASADNIGKHVMAGLTSVHALDDVVETGRIIAGGAAGFEKEPVFSFITCVIKSPLQMVTDTAETLTAIAGKGLPVVISSSPMGGATAPFDEFGMVAQINAEILAGVTFTQLISPGNPVLYGSVPVRTRLDNLNDMYGAPEFNHYSLDCTQMARYYGLPCYASAGVSDKERPGIQATVEKLLTHLLVPSGGPQYVHYAFGLLERTKTFCPVQAILDNAHIGLVKHTLHGTGISPDRKQETLDMIREVMGTGQKMYIYHLPLPTRDYVYTNYPLEDPERDALYAAYKKYEKIKEMPRNRLPAELRKEIKSKIPGVLEKTLPD
ncbi:MAG: trimethylamine methyltransferase family protein [bacterium]